MTTSLADFGVVLLSAAAVELTAVILMLLLFPKMVPGPKMDSIRDSLSDMARLWPNSLKGDKKSRRETTIL